VEGSRDRLRVIANFAATLDGKIAPASSARGALAVALSPAPEDHVRMRALRGAVDAVLIGAGNLRVDDPDLALADEMRVRRRASGEREPLRVVLTRSGRGLSVDQRIFAPERGGSTIVVHTTAMGPEVRATLSACAELVCLGEHEVPILPLLTWLRDAHGVATLLCEGGGIVAEQFFRARAIDELYLTLVPRILGGEDAPTLVEGSGFRLGEIPDARLTSVDRAGDELFLRYEFSWS
jgi:riboflavin-specific deaminase-like protein